ncbi:hypothetical protein P7L68_14165 [Tistrella mobilis]|uniref:hypothetical protein n=1 Tax=Tistrella mobilis TaxID=171437 RepID=UPI003557E70A
MVEIIPPAIPAALIRTSVDGRPAGGREGAGGRDGAGQRRAADQGQPPANTAGVAGRPGGRQDGAVQSDASGGRNPAAGDQQPGQLPRRPGEAPLPDPRSQNGRTTTTSDGRTIRQPGTTGTQGSAPQGAESGRAGDARLAGPDGTARSAATATGSEARQPTPPEDTAGRIALPVVLRGRDESGRPLVRTPLGQLALTPAPREGTANAGAPPPPSSTAPASGRAAPPAASLPSFAAGLLADDGLLARVDHASVGRLPDHRGRVPVTLLDAAGRTIVETMGLPAPDPEAADISTAPRGDRALLALRLSPPLPGPAATDPAGTAGGTLRPQPTGVDPVARLVEWAARAPAGTGLTLLSVELPAAAPAPADRGATLPPAQDTTSPRGTPAPGPSNQPATPWRALAEPSSTGAAPTTAPVMPDRMASIAAGGTPPPAAWPQVGTGAPTVMPAPAGASAPAATPWIPQAFPDAAAPSPATPSPRTAATGTVTPGLPAGPAQAGAWQPPVPPQPPIPQQAVPQQSAAAPTAGRQANPIPDTAPPYSPAPVPSDGRPPTPAAGPHPWASAPPATPSWAPSPPPASPPAPASAGSSTAGLAPEPEGPRGGTPTFPSPASPTRGTPVAAAADEVPDAAFRTAGTPSPATSAPPTTAWPTEAAPDPQPRASGRPAVAAAEAPPRPAPAASQPSTGTAAGAPAPPVPPAPEAAEGAAPPSTGRTSPAVQGPTVAASAPGVPAAGTPGTAAPTIATPTVGGATTGGAATGMVAGGTTAAAAATPPPVDAALRPAVPEPRPVAATPADTPARPLPDQRPLPAGMPTGASADTPRPGATDPAILSTPRPPEVAISGRNPARPTPASVAPAWPAAAPTAGAATPLAEPAAYQTAAQGPAPQPRLPDSAAPRPAPPQTSAFQPLNIQLGAGPAEDGAAPVARPLWGPAPAGLATAAPASPTAPAPPSQATIFPVTSAEGTTAQAAPTSPMPADPTSTEAPDPVAAGEDLAGARDLAQRTRALILAEAGRSARSPADDAPPVRPAPEHGPEASRVTGVVLGRDGNGRMLVSTALGLLSIDRPGPLPPPGTRLAVVVAPETPPAGRSGAAPGMMPAIPRPGMSAPGDWQSLADAARLIATLHPAAAERLLAPVLPTPGRDFAANLMVLLKQVLSGSRPAAADKLAEELDQLDAADTARAVLSDFDGAGRSAQTSAGQTAGGEWRSVQIPSWANATVIPVQIHIHQPRRDDDGAAEGGGRGDGICRFVVETRLSRLGDIQLDGLAAPGRVDMVMRTARPLPSGTAAALAQVMGDVLAVSGLQGGLTVRTEPPMRLPAHARPAPRPDGSGVVA